MASKIFDEMLDSFHRSAIDENPIEILKNFLRFVIRDGDLSVSGSILLYRKADDSLVLFNPDDFLFTEKFLERGKEWVGEMPSSHGLAGLAFRSREMAVSTNVAEDPRYSRDAADSPIGPMMCLPIILSYSGKPAGIVSFHNSPESKPFDPHDEVLAKRAVALLSTLLRAASGGHFSLESQSIFVIHGRDRKALDVLIKFLTGKGIKVETLGNQLRTGLQLLDGLDELITDADGVFVLMTPDDEGRLMEEEEPLEKRARENVIFEAGMACALHRRSSRVCFLVVGETNMPSDIQGLLWEKFSPYSPRLERLEQVLESWGFRWPAASA